MKIAILGSAALAACFLLAPRLAEAHHGWTEFNETAEVTLEGTVTDFHWVNPHCVVEFDVKDEKGHVQKWQGEFSNPGVLSRKGWNAASLGAGDKLTISGHPAKKQGVNAIHVTRIRTTEGRETKFETLE